MNLAEDLVESFPAGNFGCAYKQRNTDDLLRKTHRRVIAISVFEKFFAVISCHCKDRFTPAVPLLQTVDQTRQLLVDPAHSGIKKSNDLFPVAIEPASINIKPVPERIQIQSSLRRNGRRHTQGRKRIQWRVVRMMRIHQVDPQEEGLILQSLDPFDGLAN